MAYKSRNVLFLVLFLIGAWIRSLDVWRPVDGHVRESWRECDYASIARNYYREGMNLFYPRIDWRGDGPGYAEMEFPVLPWSIAILYKTFGYNEILGRILTYLISLMTLIAFFCLARYLLDNLSSLVASVFFAFNPLSIRVSDALQPEGLTLFFYILAVYLFIRWLYEDRRIWYWSAILATAAAILAKLPSIHIGILFLVLLLSQKGIKSLKKPKIWIFGLLSVLPALLWHLHARGFWLTYGNSLGVSNEYHWVGLDLFTNPIFITRLAIIEISYVWMPLGVVIALAILWLRRSDRSAKVCLFWLISLIIYYIITIRTTGSFFALYYHIFSVPPAALLMGKGAGLMNSLFKEKRLFIVSIIISFSLSLGIILGKVFFNLSYPKLRVTGVLLLSLAAATALLPFIAKGRRQSAIFPEKSLFAYFLLICLLSISYFQSYRISKDLYPDTWQPRYECAQLFKPLIPENALILASGGESKDDRGHSHAYNASYYFFWLDRKGFSIPDEEQTVQTVKNFRDRGARYFVLEKRALYANPDFEEELSEVFTLLKQCDKAYLFELLDKL
jgi:4-amino-4-deoxy-L-arabinose transferase-like glycosyltransferase